MKFKSLMFMTAATILAGCSTFTGEETIISVNDEAKPKGTVYLRITEANTGKALDSVSVECLINQKTETSDENGIAVFSGNTIGEYAYMVSKKGYASMKVYATVSEEGKGDVARVPDVIREVSLNRNGVSVSGTVMMMENGTSNRIAAEEVTVVLHYSDPAIYPAEISTKTDKTGAYEFTDLPEDVKFVISVPQTEYKSLTYGSGTDATVDAHRVNEKASAGIITLNVIGVKPILVSTNLTDLDTTSSIKLNFSTMLEEDSVSTSWTVRKGSCSSGSDVLVSASLDENGKTVVIKSVSGKWNMDNYCVAGTAYSIDGTYVTVSESFSAGVTESSAERPSNATDVKMTYDSGADELTLTWKAPKEDIDGYKIYYKTDRMADFVYFGSADYDDESYVVDVYYDLPSDIDEVSFYVLPYVYDGSKSLLAEYSDKNTIMVKKSFD